MAQYSCFDIIGPVMVGPSSSHTAGAVRLGLLAKEIAGGVPQKVELYLHGSFAKTYQGHGTDLALIGGLLGFNTDDVRIRDSFSYAEKAGMYFKFIPTDLGENYHPNTVKFIIQNRNNEEITIIGSSVGGGNVAIKEINDYALHLTGELPALLTFHNDIPGVIAQVTAILAKYKINVAFMEVFRKEKRKIATMVLETDEIISQESLEQIRNLEAIIQARIVQPV